ncbi:MAG: hypothetical protein A2015_02090 [Spirochaetes bacterium GWF1_31_7]|nr:MAG: hypothetical protein A2Y30_11955 [Spirochaetes bacterium GWE1_32_154]OHD44684.1 MAG: hypothetical protein A2Y29_05790 [Spirochaetes bacterium GWE2_31_10]OHD47056.1 MAG: hypothetical protein A2015_02090 [Spirochaetes bacterium GWF1_31_7]OHD83337.1 MAG: hypothetical protein A2355_04730 [Spirochaetes bacterium RIFOXYB1_FULL_32_8]
MNTAVIKKQIFNDIEILNETKLLDLLNYLNFLKNREENDPTLEIIENDDFYNQLKRGITEKENGQVFDWNSSI